MKISAGTLLYRIRNGETEVLLVHPSGHYNRAKPWGIPKGMPDEGESLEAAARRETLEEAGVTAGELESIGFIDYKKSGKRIHAFAGPAPEDARPRCASWEVDGAEFMPLDRAKELIHPDQRPFLDRLAKKLAGGPKSV
jgi:predicted NUDIX family NTP pyrophosphohydrolase